MLDVGSGTGAVLRHLAKRRPECVFDGIEVAPAPWLLSTLLARAQANVRFRRADFFVQSWRGHDVVYAFLSPVPMARVWEKAQRELPAGATVISNAFPVPGAAPERTVEVDDARGTILYVYRVAGAGSTTK
ncbi:class I SAM-dependent methyltransferase [Aromatoleum sp.]|uniref:class I SAM-dependent methyltransferase n=1 Tax=Aromatoleum sp. TaxID=2307007 RepID=UPI002FC96B07